MPISLSEIKKLLGERRENGRFGENGSFGKKLKLQFSLFSPFSL